MSPVDASPDVRLPLHRRYRRILPSGLWIPEHPQSVDETPDPSRMAATYVSYSHVFGEKPTWEDAAERLREYSLSTILRVIGGVSGALHPAGSAHSTEVQSKLVQGLLEERPNCVLLAWSELLADVKGAGTDLPSPVVVFHELQLVNAAKLALLEVPPDNESTADTLEILGEALLAVNDLIEPDEPPGKSTNKVHDDEDRRAWASYFIVNGRFNASGNPMHELARSHELYLTDRPHLRDKSGAYMNLPATAEDLTGMPLEELLARNTAVYSRWGKGLDEDSGQLPTPIRVDSYFTENFDFDERTEKGFWREMSATAESLCEEFRDAGCGDGNLRPYYVLPFEKRPLVEHEGWAHCPSSLLLCRKVGAGLHFLFQNGLESDDCNRYLTYRGAVLEDYITDIVESIVSDGGGTFVRAETLERAAEGSVCDGVILSGDTATLLEVKSRRLRLGARTKGDWAEIREFLDDVFLQKAAEQLDSTITLVRNGSLDEQGLDPDRIKVYLPVVITLEPVPMQPPLYNLVRSAHNENDLLSGPDTKPLQHLTVEDLELLEAAASQGYKIRSLLRDRVNQGGHQLPFKSWAWQYDQSLAEVPNERLKAVFEDMIDDAVDYLRSHAEDYTADVG